MTERLGEGLCSFKFAGLDPKFPARANFTFYREHSKLPASAAITFIEHAISQRITQLAGPRRLGGTAKGKLGNRIRLCESTVGLCLVQIRGTVDDCAMPSLDIDLKKRVISLEWKDLFTRFFGGKMMADGVLEQAPVSDREHPMNLFLT